MQLCHSQHFKVPYQLHAPAAASNDAEIQITCMSVPRPDFLHDDHIYGPDSLPSVHACQLSRAAICACLATGVCVGSVTLELWVMRGTCSWSALLLQISETNFLHWLQSAQVSWLGLCGPVTSPWSAGTSLLALIGCHADARQMLPVFHPFSLVGCQG